MTVVVSGSREQPVMHRWGLASSVALIVAAACTGPSAAVDAGLEPIDAGEPDAAPADAAVDASVDAPPDAPPDGPAIPPGLTSIAPVRGAVTGGSIVTIEGTLLQQGATVSIGGIPCAPVAVVSASLVICTTGDSRFVEGAMDVVVTNPDGAMAALVGAYTYECLWTTSLGRRSCGAVPPRPAFAAQVVAAWVTRFEAGHGFSANPAVAGTTDDLDDTSDAVLGTQSATIETDGAGTPRVLVRTGGAPIDFTDHVPKLWVKLTNVTRAVSLQLYLGDSNLTNHFRFAFHSTQGQRWATEGDWVAFTMSWAPQNVTVQGTPNRAAITDVQFRIVDDATGHRVRFRVNGLGLVAEPASKYPGGVLSMTFDDNFDSMVSEGLPRLAAHGYPATAYVIADLVDDPGRATLAELRALQDTHGWDIAAHAYTTAHHATRFTNLSAGVLEDDLVDLRGWLIANGFAGYDHCAYPGGNFTGGLGTDVLALAGRYFASCRTIYQGEREAYLPSDARKLRVFYITNATTLASAIAAVDAAHAHREWIILVFHKLVAAPAVSTEWGIADFEALVAHIAVTGIPVKTVGQILADP